MKKCTLCKKIMKSSEIPSKKHSYRNHRCIYCGDFSYTEKKGKTVFIDSFICNENGISLSGNVVIPEYVYYEGNTCKVTGVDQMAFQNNNQISSIILPKSVKYIGDFAFDTCQNLSSVELPERLEYIGYAAFQCCYKLDKIVFPKGLRYIRNYSYNHLCSANNSSIWIPESIELFGENDIHYPAHMFYDCGTEAFTTFKVSKNNSSYKAINGILYTKDGKTLVSIPRGKKFKNQTYVMPNSISNLGELSFSRNQNIKNVIISDNLIVDGKMNTIENASYINKGNDLSIAIYQYCPVQKYLTKKSNSNYTSINGILYSKDLTHVVAIPSFYNGDIIIEEGTTYWDLEALWADEDVISQCFQTIPSIYIPSTLIYIEERQLNFLNLLAEKLSIRLSVSEENPMYVVSGNRIQKK